MLISDFCSNKLYLALENNLNSESTSSTPTLEAKLKKLRDSLRPGQQQLGDWKGGKWLFLRFLGRVNPTVLRLLLQ